MYIMSWLLALETTSTPALLIKRYLLMLFKVLVQLRPYFKTWIAEMQVYQKAISSIVTRLGPETQSRASLLPIIFQFRSSILYGCSSKIKLIICHSIYKKQSKMFKFVNLKLLQNLCQTSIFLTYLWNCSST